MSEHTNGPWHYEDDGTQFTIYATNKRVLGTEEGLVGCVYINTIRPDREAQANARLIAAAPKLLKALKLLKSDCKMALSSNWNRSDEGFVAMLEVAEAAIAKAEGK